MDRVSLPKSEWTLREEGLAGFLHRLDPDYDTAGEKYERLRLTLIKFFDWRGAHFPDEYADETINRVIRKLEDGETITDVPTFCHGVARMLLLEKLKGPDSRKSDLETAPAIALIAHQPEESDPRLECLTRCLAELPPEGRELILRYYSDDKRQKINNRLALSEELGIPLNAVRSRAQRIRDKLERCIRSCSNERDRTAAT
jgi:DNA-directed RNA polymerase specialized sigma24 family protein